MCHGLYRCCCSDQRWRAALHRGIWSIPLQCWWPIRHCVWQICQVEGREDPIWCRWVQGTVTAQLTAHSSCEAVLCWQSQWHGWTLILHCGLASFDPCAHSLLLRASAPRTSVACQDLYWCHSYMCKPMFAYANKPCPEPAEQHAWHFTTHPCMSCPQPAVLNTSESFDLW